MIRCKKINVPSPGERDSSFWQRDNRVLIGFHATAQLEGGTQSFTVDAGLVMTLFPNICF